MKHILLWVLLVVCVLVTSCTGKLPEEEQATPVAVQGVDGENRDIEANTPVPRSEPLTLKQLRRSGTKFINLNTLNDVYSHIENQPIQHDPTLNTLVFVVVLDTLRDDMITPENAPVITDFLGQADTTRFTKARGAATSTAHSLFGMYYGILPHLRVNLIDNAYVNLFNGRNSESRPYLKGSYYLRIFKKMGFQVESFGEEDVEFCVNDGQPFASEQKTFLQLNFSRKSSDLLDYCEKYLFYDQKDPKYNAGLSDNYTVTRFLDRMEGKANFNTPTLTLMRLSGVHHPYGWLRQGSVDQEYAALTGYDRWLHPSSLGIFAGPKRAELKETVLHSYRNSVRSADMQIWRIFKYLKQKNLYDRSIIVLVSDHGHALMDLPDPNLSTRTGHGYEPYSQLANIFFAIKWPHGMNPLIAAAKKTGKAVARKVASHTSPMASIMDLFPTLLGYFKVDSKAYTGGLPVSGEDLVVRNPTCTVTFKPTYDYDKDFVANPLTVFTVDNGSEKFMLKLELYKNLAYKNRVTVLKHLTEDDQVIRDSGNPQKVREYLELHFSECLKQILSPGKAIEVGT